MPSLLSAKGFEYKDIFCKFALLIMKTCLTFITIFFIVLSMSSVGQYSVKWNRNTGGSGADFGKSICLSADSTCYYIAGYSNSVNFDILDNNGGFDIFISKIDHSGSTLWTKCFGGAGNDYVHKIITLSDNNILICGFTSSNDTFFSGNHGGYDVLLMKIDTSGAIIWKKLYGGSADDGDHSMSVIEGQDHKITVITGTKSSGGDIVGSHGSGDFWLFKTDSSGNLIWQKCFGGSGDEDGHAILPMDDGGYILAGHTFSDDMDVSGLHSVGKEDGWLLRTDSSLNIKWQKCLGGTNIEFLNNMCFDGPGKLLITGFTNSNDYDIVNNHGDYDAWLLKVDTSGNIIWSKTFGGTGGDYSCEIINNHDGSFIIGGYSNSIDGDLNYNYGGFDYSLFKIDSSGGLVWQNNFGGSLTDKVQAVSAYFNGDILMTGFSNSTDNNVTGNKGGMDSWTIRTGCTKPIADFIPSSAEVCSGELVSFLNNSSGALNYEWFSNSTMFSDSLNPQTVATIIGNNTITLISAFDGCADTLSIVINVKPMPLVDLGNDTLVISGSSFVLDAENIGAVYDWSTGEHTSSIVVYPPGTYSVHENLDGCEANDTISIGILTGINIDKIIDGVIEIFPIPFDDKINIWSDKTEAAESITISDFTGKIYLKKLLSSNKEIIDMSNLKKGIYFLKIIGVGFEKTYKVVKI